MAVSDVNMSSEGSGSSKLRQFGLYKTIDSRTAEFLKLSRQRQLRRGCACAAVSTAITVTVVVSALLVYEYGFHTESKLAPSTLRKFNWFNSVNESDIPFDKNKETLTNNKNNNKLLPIILKALDQKRYLETIIDEQSTLSYDRTTEYTIKKDVFTDPRNWKTSRQNDLGYKGFPKGLFKTKHIDSFSTVRKLIDYQRVMAYLNSMSTEKIVGPVDSIFNDIYTTLKPDTTTYGDVVFDYNRVMDPDPSVSLTENKKPYKNLGHIVKSNDGENKKYCKCSNHSNLEKLLKQVFNSIQQLRPKTIDATTHLNKARPNVKNLTDFTIHPPKENITKILSENKMTPFYNFSVNPLQYKSIKLTSALLPATETMKTSTHNCLSNIRKEYSMMRDEYIKNLVNTEEMPWKFDFRAKGIEAMTIADTQNEKPTTTKKTILYTSHTEVKTTTSKVLSNIGGGLVGANDDNNDDDETEQDFADENINRIMLEARPVSSPRPHTRTDKSTSYRAYNYLANYMDDLSKLYAKTFIVNKPPNVETITQQPSTAKAIDLQKFSMSEGQDPPIKFETTSSDAPVTMKSIELLTSKSKEHIPGLPPAVIYSASITNKNPPSLIPKNKKPFFVGKLDASVDGTKQSNALLPMIQSYLLSKKDDKVLNLHYRSTVKPVIMSSSASSDELPFDLKFYSNEENERIYPNFLKNMERWTAAPFTSLNKHNKSQSNLNVHTKRERIKTLKTTTKSKTKDLPQTQKYNSGKVHHKTKKVLYMTGTEVPVESFEENLNRLMYFEKSPVNYTAVTSLFLNRSDSGSTEKLKSMVPQIKTPFLDIRRNHEEVDFDNHLEYDERI